MQPLTRRHRDVIRLRCDQGLTVRQMAKEMHISPQTVKNHITEAKRRAGVRAFTQLCTKHGRLTMLRDLVEGRASLADELGETE